VLSYTKDKYLQIDTFVKHALICMRLDVISQGSCATAAKWKRDGENGKLLRVADEDLCLTRGDDATVKLKPCRDSSMQQQWLFTGSGSLSDPEKALCLDNMQKSTGAPGLYGCHGGGTQRWLLTEDGALLSEGTSVCLNLVPSPAFSECAPDDKAYVWHIEKNQIRPELAKSFCLTNNAGATATLAPCDMSREDQFWNYQD
jgi:polypeptide N-acetylgalactosaminyltransferase